MKKKSPPSNVKVVASEQEARDIMANAAGPVVLQFTAEWCGQCPAEKKRADKIAASCDTLTVIRVDEAVAGKLREDYRVDELGGFPTSFYAEKGSELKPGMDELSDLSDVKDALKCKKK